MGPLEVSNLAALAEIISVEECQVVWFVQKIMAISKKGQWSHDRLKQVCGWCEHGVNLTVVPVYSHVYITFSCAADVWAYL